MFAISPSALCAYVCIQYVYESVCMSINLDSHNQGCYQEGCIHKANLSLISETAQKQHYSDLAQPLSHLQISPQLFLTHLSIHTPILFKSSSFVISLSSTFTLSLCFDSSQFQLISSFLHIACCDFCRSTPPFLVITCLVHSAEVAFLKPLYHLIAALPLFLWC